MNYQKLIPAYINHLESGLSEKSFVPCDYLELEEFAQKENLMDKINQAKRASQKFWESLATKAYYSDMNRFYYELWIFVMKARFGWSDIPKVEKPDTPKVVEVQLMLNRDQKFPEEENSYNV